MDLNQIIPLAQQAANFSTPLVAGDADAPGSEFADLLSSPTGGALGELLPQLLETADLAGLFGTGGKSFLDGTKLEWSKALDGALPAGQKAAILDQIAELDGLSKGLGWANAGFGVVGILGAEDKSDALFEAAGGVVGAKVGQSVGSSLGAGLMLSFGVTAPLAPVGAAVGGALGSMVGEELGEMAGGELGDLAEEVFPEMEEGLDAAGDALSDAWDSVGDLF